MRAPPAHWLGPARTAEARVIRTASALQPGWAGAAGGGRAQARDPGFAVPGGDLYGWGPGGGGRVQAYLLRAGGLERRAADLRGCSRALETRRRGTEPSEDEDSTRSLVQPGFLCRFPFNGTPLFQAI